MSFAMMKKTLPAAVVAAFLSGSIGIAAAADADSTASSTLKNQEGTEVGSAELRQVDDAVFMHIKLTGLPQGTHALHFHEKSTCEPPFKTAGGHYNPEDKQHGLFNEDGWHEGDLPNIHVPENGNLELEILTSVESLEELLDDDGASIMIHEGADDYTTDPAGDAGKRIACGPIEAGTK